MELGPGHLASYESISGTCITDVSPPFGGHNGLFIPYPVSGTLEIVSDIDGL